MRIFIVNHPSKEPGYGHTATGSRITVPWNSTDSHHRKFIERNGDYLDASGQRMRAVLYFWGEYEPKSRAVKLAPSRGAKAVNQTLFPVGGSNIVPISKTAKCLNTDPYVFGDEFYYFCCQRKKTTYQKGDIILFGSTHGPRNSIQFLLDTVIVVKEERDIKRFSTNSNYWKCSLDPRLFKGTLLHQSVVIGGTILDDYHTFSFVPCTIDLHNRGAKPMIDITKYGFAPINNYQLNRNPIVQNAFCFQNLLNDVRNQGFEIAVLIDGI